MYDQAHLEDDMLNSDQHAMSWQWDTDVIGTRKRLIRDVLLVVKGVLYLVDLWSVETGLEYDESDVPKDTR